MAKQNYDETKICYIGFADGMILDAQRLHRGQVSQYSRNCC